jgi:hypothetical protein
MSDAARPVHVQRGRRTLLLLALVFLGPMVVAMLLWFTGFQWRPAATTEHGVLYRPARPLPASTMTIAETPATRVPLAGKWTLIHIGPGNCDAACRTALVEMRQVRRALGRDRDRVQRLYLVTAGAADLGFLAGEHAGIGVLGPGPEAVSLVEIAGGAAPGEIFLADPLGNLVMRYPAGTGMKGIHTDLARLLKISTIG